MARRKARMTAFSRLILFMVFIGPLAYIAASYYNGQDGIKNITTTIQKGKDKVSTILSGNEENTPSTTTTSSTSGSSSIDEISGSAITIPPTTDQSYQIKRLKGQLEELDLENRQLRRTIRELKAELEAK